MHMEQPGRGLDELEIILDTTTLDEGAVAMVNKGV
jgi:hypothetical protein